VVAGGDGKQRLFPGGDLGADGVFLDHGGHGLGEGAGRAQEGGDGGEARLVAGHVMQFAKGPEPAEAGDQAVEALALGLGAAVDLDGHAQAGGGDGVLQLLEGLRVEVAAVAGKRVLGDGVERDEVDLVWHGARSGKRSGRAG
jgi:hypothetical protein